MIDREMIIKGLEMSYKYSNVDENNTIVPQQIVLNALALLKEQEAVKPRKIDGKRNHFIKCGNCNYDLLTGFQFCPHCGREVKWE